MGGGLFCRYVVGRFIKESATELDRHLSLFQYENIQEINWCLLRLFFLFYLLRYRITQMIFDNFLSFFFFISIWNGRRRRFIFRRIFHYKYPGHMTTWLACRLIFPTHYYCAVCGMSTSTCSILVFESQKIEIRKNARATTKEKSFLYFLSLKPKSTGSVSAKTNIDQMTTTVCCDLNVSLFIVLWFVCLRCDVTSTPGAFDLLIVMIGPKFDLNKNGDDTRLRPAVKMLIVSFLVHPPVSNKFVLSVVIRHHTQALRIHHSLIRTATIHCSNVYYE